MRWSPGKFGRGGARLVASVPVRTSARRPFLALLVLLAIVLGACTDDGELGGPTIGGTLAAKVGEFEYRNADLEDEVELWASNPAFLSLLQITDLGAPGRRSSPLVTFVLSNRIVSEQARAVGAAQGYQPSDAEIDEVLAQVDANFVDPTTGSQVFGLFPADFRRQLGADLAFQSQLQSFNPDAATVPDVQVNPKYGRVELDGLGFAQVQPPAGPLPVPGLAAPVAE